MADQTQRRWYNDTELFLHGLARSNYVTAITDWFMGFAGKWAELVLYGTVLYSCAELYPGVHLPAGLSLAVFLVQLGALDIGGLSLAKLAKQAREDGNVAGAKNAELLSKWLIGIMLVGVVTVGLEHALPVTLPSWVITSVNVLLVVARSICAVLYGRVVHDLKQEMVRMMPVAKVQANISELFTEHLQRIEANTERRIVEVERRLAESVSTLQGNLQSSTEALSTLPALKEQLAQFERTAGQQLTSMAEEVSRVKTTVEQQAVSQAVAPVKPSSHPSLYALPPAHQKQAAQSKEVRQASPEAKSDEKFDIGAFVHRCLEENAESTIEAIQQRALSIGQTVSTGSISRYRKMFFETRQAV